MAFDSRRYALALGILASLTIAETCAQQQVYRQVDPAGRTIYSDRAPSGPSRDLQVKRLTPNFIETDADSLPARTASKNFPVTLFTFACGEPCQHAEGLLNKRGVPFTQVDVEKDPKAALRLKALTGEASAPVLQVGDKLVAKGFNEARWQAMLDDAGYPKTAAPRRVTVARPAAAPARAQALPEPDVPAPPATRGGYPAN